MDNIEKLVEERAKDLVRKKDEKSAVQTPSPVDPCAPFEVPDDKSYAQRAREIVGVLATQEAIKDETLVKDVTNRRKAALLNSADADMKREEAENKKAEIELQEANYGVYSGVANYAGIKKPLPKRMQNILFTILSALQMIYLIAFGIPISIINITADGIDSVVKKLGTLTKSAMWIVLVIIIGFAIFCGVQVVQFFVDGFVAN